LDRRTDDPDGSGGASPTVVTSRHDGDNPTSENGQDTRQARFVASPLMPRVPEDSAPAPSAWDALAAGSIAEENGKDAAATDTTADDEPARTDGALGTSGFDSSAFDVGTFGSSFSWSETPGSWSPSDPEESPADGSLVAAMAPGEPDAIRPADPPYGAAHAQEPPVSPPTVPAPPFVPDPPPAVSAAAFTWDTPEPSPTSPSSPARAFLRSAGSAKPPPPAPARPPIDVSSTPRPVPLPSQVSVRKAPPKAASKAASRRSVRQAHLTIARVEPWSVMKFSFVVSLVAFVILFVAVSVLWGSLSALGVFDSLQRVVSNVTSSQTSSGVNAARWFSASRVLGWTALLGSLNIVLITAMSTIGAVVYNLTSRLVGGVEVTLRETE
jgi:Transmembrane domain of unknown function (DUF3566)